MAPTENSNLSESSLSKSGSSKFDESKVKRDGDGQFARTASAKDQPKRDAGPTTVAGYQKMFDKVPVAQWGGGDVGISHLMPDGRRIWLYGDTVSGNNGFVHSTALVQTGGKLHVSQGGKQLLPNSGKDPADPSRELIHWIDGVKQGPTPNTLVVSSMQMSVGKANPWDFRKTREGQSKKALVKVDGAGNLTFVKWQGWGPVPQKNNPHLANDFQTVGPNHYTYGKVTHDIKLADGSKLTTTSQNWDDPMTNHLNPDGSLKYSDWAPLFGKTSASGELRMATPLDAFLEHHGVKGMKWGEHKARLSSVKLSGKYVPTKEQLKFAGKELSVGSIGPAAMLMGLGPPLSLALGVSVAVLRSPPVSSAIASSSKATANLMKEIGHTKVSAMKQARAAKPLAKNAAKKTAKKAKDAALDNLDNIIMLT